MTRNASPLLAAGSSPSSSEAPDSSQVVASEQTKYPERDRIAEAYLGRWGSRLTQQRARERIDWMAASVEGPRILDIGCSEGILALLLARAGHRVVGVDIEPEAIKAATALLDAEPAAVRDRVELRVGDVLTIDLGERGFETVAVGEVIEHLADPAALLERAAAYVKPGGRLVLTTPFGYFPHPDHRQEFRTTALVNLLSARFVIDQLTVVDGYFRVTADVRSVPVLEERRVQDRRAPSLHQLLVATEEAAIDSQQHLYGQLDRLQGQLTRRTSEVAELRRLLVATEEAAVASQNDLHGRLEALNRRRSVGSQSERVLTEKVRRLELQLEQQRRVVAVAQTRMQQAQLRLKQQQKGLRQELGRAVERSLQSPLGVFWMPFRITKAYRRARPRADAELLAPCPPLPSSNGDAGGAPAILRNKNRDEPERIIPHQDLSSAFPPYPFPERAPRSTARVGTILDEFSDACFRYEANLIRLTKENWRAQMECHRPEFLFVESAWRGNGESWRGLIKSADHTLDNPLEALVNYCKARGIPTVFWNKEDPPNFEHFIDAAAKFDHVFTTDANCIERYHTRLGHQRLAALPFAAQPAIHNPIGKIESDDHEIAFAGTWYGQKHEERGALLPILLDAASDQNLHIFDRMSGHTGSDFYKFPDRYTPFLRMALAYPNMLSAYRSFKVFLNVNSVTDSPTMFARRVFEILASETAIVSTASTGIKQMLGDVVAVIHDEEEARAELEKLLSDAGYRQRKAHAGYRKIMREHTYEARFRTVLRAIGWELHDLAGPFKVSVIIPLCDDNSLESAAANVRRQRHPDIDPLWIVKDGAAGALAERIMSACPGGRIVEAGADASFVTMVARGIEVAEGDLIAVFGPRGLYGPEFIGDLALAFAYADAAIVGKASYFSATTGHKPPLMCEPTARYRYVDRVLGTAWLARRELLQRSPVHQMLYVENGCPMLGSINGSHKIYSADPYNYLKLQTSESPPAGIAAKLDECGSIDIDGAEIMI